MLLKLALFAAQALAEPLCVELQPQDSTRSALERAGVTDGAELLARLTYAESTSTGFPDDPLVHRTIAWGVMNRVRLGERSASSARSYGAGVAGVIFQPVQFNPAVSTRSPFSKDFLCPSDPARWALASAAAAEALAGEGNPLIGTDWEREHDLSLVVNFYYPSSVQAEGVLAPWEGTPSLSFIGDVPVGPETLSADRVRFYRLTSPPGDLR